MYAEYIIFFAVALAHKIHMADLGDFRKERSSFPDARAQRSR